MNPLFQKQTNDDQDPIILPQDDNEQGDMLDPATQKVAPPPPVAPAEDEKIVEPVRLAGRKGRGGRRPSGGSQRNLDNYLDATREGDRIRAEWAANKAKQEEEKKNPLLEKESAGAPFGEGYGNQNCYKCKQPIQQGATVSWEGGMESHTNCPAAPQGAQEQSRIMFPKGQQPKKPQMGPTQPQTPQRAPNKPQYASAEKVATRRKISGFVPATSWGVPQEYAHRVAETLANAGMRDFDVATDEEQHVAFFSFGNEAEMEVSADIVCEFYRSQISASKGKWIGWQCRPERQPGVPNPQTMPFSKMNSQKRAGAIDKLKAVGIKTTADLDKWIKRHPRKITKGPYAGQTELASRFEALTELVGGDAATMILHEMATDAAAKEIPGKRSFFSPQDAKRFRDDNQGSNVALNQDEKGSERWEKVPQSVEELLKKQGAVDPSNYEGGTIEEQVANLMEKRSFSEDGKGNGWVIYSRNTEYPDDGTWLKVFFKDGKVAKTDMFDEEPENVLETRVGFDGLHSFTQAFGD
jgi:hypothetical protein